MTRGSGTPTTRTAAAAVLTGLALLVAPASAGAGPSDAEDALRRLRAEAGGPVLVARYAGSTRVKTLKGLLSPASGGTPAEVAGSFLRDQAPLFGLRADAGDLALVSLRRSPAGAHLAYRQTLAGLPVFNGGVEVTLDGERRVRLVHNRYFPGGAPAAAPGVSVEACVAAATENLLGRPAPLPAGGGPAGRAASRLPSLTEAPQLGVFIEGEKPCLAWRFVLESEAPFELVEYTVDAGGGGILLRRELVQRVVRDGSGDVFDPNPVNALNDTSLRDAADAAAFAGAYRSVVLPGLTYVRKTRTYLLRGQHVLVTDAKERPYFFRRTKGIVASRSGNFLAARSSKKFEHAMCYYHIDANQRYIQGLGFTDVNHRRIRVDPHGRGGADGSHYVARPIGSGYLAFGTGGVDDAEDADVILHEYAHAVQDNQAPGKYLGAATEAAAMGEGFADYWAASSTYDASVANGFDPACVGEWDRAPGCLGRVDGDKTYPGDMVGDADRDGELWAAALWDLFATTGDRGATDSIVLQSHFLVPDAPTFGDGVEALLDADEFLYAGAHQGQICSVMTARGIPAAGCQFRATVTWDNPFVDLDLHLRPPDGAGYAGWDYENDCYSLNPNPDWGTAEDTSDDPLLRIDCKYATNPGCHEEQIVLKEFSTPGAYEVLVHFYGFKYNQWFEDQTTTAEVRVYQGGALLSSATRLLVNPDNFPETGDLWSAFTLDVSP